MARHQVVCTIRHDCPASPLHFHALYVGTGDPTLYDRVWSTPQVRAAMDAGEKFYVTSDGSETELAINRCPGCGMDDVLTIPVQLPELR